MAKLSDVCDLINEKIKLNEEICKNLKLTYITTENMLPNKNGITLPSKIPQSGSVISYLKSDTLVSNIRPYFKKIWFAKYNGGCSNDVLVFRAKQGVSSDFIYYTLANDKFFEYSMQTSKGTKMPRGDKKSIMDYEISLFDYEIQRKSTILLKLIDEKINNNNKINNNLAS